MKGLNRETAKACVGPGWATLIDRFYNHVEANQKHKYPDIQVVEVKEKFGGLRIYFWGADEFLEGFTWALESWSQTICEKCGKQGRVNASRGWYKTQCKDHWDGPEEWHVQEDEG